MSECAFLCVSLTDPVTKLEECITSQLAADFFYDIQYNTHPFCGLDDYRLQPSIATGYFAMIIIQSSDFFGHHTFIPFCNSIRVIVLAGFNTQC